MSLSLQCSGTGNLTGRHLQFVLTAVVIVKSVVSLILMIVGRTNSNPCSLQNEMHLLLALAEQGCTEFAEFAEKL